MSDSVSVRPWTPAAIDAGINLVKLLGRDQARTLLSVLELPDERLPFIPT